MATITINGLNASTTDVKDINSVLPLYQGDDNTGDTFKITPANLVGQTLGLSSSQLDKVKNIVAPTGSLSEDKYLNQLGEWAPVANTTYAVATQSTDGLMSSADKTKVDNMTTAVATLSANGLMSSADRLKINNLTTAVATTAAPGYLQLNGSANLFLNGAGNWATPPGSTYADATTTTHGLMTATDKQHLNSAYKHSVTNKGTSAAAGLYKIQTNSQGHVTEATSVTKADITALGIPGSNTTYAVASTSANGLMSSVDKTSLTNLSSVSDATTVVHGYMSTGDKTKVDKIDNVWYYQLHEIATTEGQHVRFHRYGDLVFVYCLANLAWTNGTTFKIPTGFQPASVCEGKQAFHGRIFTAQNGIVGSIRMYNSLDPVPHLTLTPFNTSGVAANVTGIGEVWGMWITDSATLPTVDSTHASTYEKTSF